MRLGVRIENYKSFGKNFEIEFGPLSIVAGPNAAGKSNLISALAFVKNAVISNNLQSATAGRWDDIRCRKRYGVKEICFGIEVKFRERDIKYSFVIRRDGDDDPDVVVQRETARVDGRGYERVNAQRVETTQGPASGVDTFKDFLDRLGKDELEEWKDRLLASMKIPVAGLYVYDFVSRWEFFNVDPETAREACMEGQQLTERGKGLPNLLKEIEEARSDELAEAKRRVNEHMEYLVPGFEKWETKTQTDGTIIFLVKERKTKKKFPPDGVSDGTVRLLCILGLIFHPYKKHSLIVIEEIEKALHPKVLENLVDVLRAAAKDRFIIVTTHSPSVVRACKREELILMDKKRGFSQVYYPHKQAEIDRFLEEFSLDELWLKGLLGQKGLPF